MAEELRADRARFAEAASMWHDIALTVNSGATDVAYCSGKGSEFGFLATPIHAEHDK